ncbi:MAG: FtsX-like permease family protein [Bacteroidetes bacterium]|jgi:ABC-type antimicrobial peptide transport system permease subunit|nr:FtsX-like permease family protein [Bacteroidota bacterium]
MLKNYLKIAFRQLFKNKTFSIINISGLAIGMAAFMLLFLWIQNEVSYDKFHSKKDRLYDLWNKAMWSGKLECWNTTPKAAAKPLRQHFPEIESVARVDWQGSRLMVTGDKKLFSSGTTVDPEFLTMFDFPLLKGNIKTVLKDPGSIVITPTLSEKLFGKEDPMGKVIKVDNENSFTVTGVVSDPPNNTRFRFEYLLPWKHMEKGTEEDNNWGNNSTHTYVLLTENSTITSLQPKIKELRKTYGNDADVYDMFLYPLERLRLYGEFENGVETGGGKIEMVRLLGIIAGFILLIACINFMNLSTARSEKRAKEVGIRKTVGAFRTSLIRQFLGETLVISSISFCIAVILVQLCMPAYNRLTLKNLSVDYSDPWFWTASIGFIMLTGLLAGSYPAFYLSSFNPVKVLKGTFRSVSAVITPRKVLVVIQFVFAIVLIIATIIVKQQINHVAERDAGYNKDKLVFHFMSNDLTKNYQRLKNDLLQQSLAESVTKTNSPLTDGWSDSWGFEWAGKDPNDRTDFDRYSADEGIARTAGLKLSAGRDLDLKKFPTDSFGILINESALKTMGFKQPLGQIVKDGDLNFHIVGVFKDFIINSPYSPTKPMIITGAGNNWFNVIHIRLKHGAEDLKKIEPLFKKYNPEFPFEYSFVDQEYEAKFDDMKRIAKMATWFAGLTIFISCLGLFGLSANMAENRVKEIGVRKVLGASAAKITVMLSANFIKLVVIAFVIAAPLAWWLMSKWLEDYSYRIRIEWWVFVLAAFISILISIITVVYQSLKAALANPVKSLRTE